MTVDKYETKIVYQIYFIERGLLVEPTNFFGDKMFVSYDSIEEALEKINKDNEGMTEYVVLPVSQTSLK